jgi:hypothetical protein
MDTTALSKPTKTRRKPSHGSHGAMDKPRATADFYRSPTHAMAMLLDSIHPDRLAPADGLILDAGAGDGRLTLPLMRHGYRVQGIDLHDRDPDPFLPITAPIDFLTTNPGDFPKLAAIITNPPFDLSDEFIRHALALLPDGGQLHALLRHSWMTAISRADLLPSLQRIVLCRRLKMLPFDREHDDKGHDGAVDFSWFTFTKGRTSGGCQLLHPPTTRPSDT